jgi:hypothetical protein
VASWSLHSIQSGNLAESPSATKQQNGLTALD